MELLPLRPCMECWKTFEPTKRSQKYCSDACKDIAKIKAKQAKGEYKKKGRQRMGTPLDQRHWAALRFAILRRDGFQCKYCGRTPNDGAKLHVDHILAVSRGGSNNPENLVTACDSCNLGKFDALLTQQEEAIVRSRIREAQEASRS